MCMSHLAAAVSHLAAAVSHRVTRVHVVGQSCGSVLAGTAVSLGGRAAIGNGITNRNTCCVIAVLLCRIWMSNISSFADQNYWNTSTNTRGQSYGPLKSFKGVCSASKEQPSECK